MPATIVYQPLTFSAPSNFLNTNHSITISTIPSKTRRRIISPSLQFKSNLSSSLFLHAACLKEFPDINDNDKVADELANALQRCAATASVSEGVQIHARIIHIGLSADPYLASQLLFFYCCCRLPNAARAVFDATPSWALNLFFWNVMIRAYVDSGCYADAIGLFYYMISSGFYPNRFTFPFVLKSCSLLNCLHLGREIHGLMVVSGFQHDIFAASALLDMYSKCGYLGDACKLFDRISDRNLVTWNSMISAFAQNGRWVEALQVLDVIRDQVQASSWNSLIAGCVRYGDVDLALEMLGRMLTLAPSLKPNLATINTLVYVVPTIRSLNRLKEFHAFAIRWQDIIGMDYFDDERLRSAITAGYIHHGLMVYSSQLFDGICSKTSQLWNSMISGFINCGQPDEAFCIFRRMVSEQHVIQFGIISKFSLTLLLSECSLSSLAGLEMHACAYRTGWESDTSVNNALIAMYARKGDIELAQRVFERIAEKDVVSWNTMVSCYARSCDFDRAFNLFHQMRSEDMKPDDFTFSAILNGCGHSVALQQGMCIHGYLIKSGFSKDYYSVVQNALMDMYGKCGCIEEAELVFDEMTYRDDISWNTIISCYSANAHPNEAFAHFHEMQEHGWKPNRITFIALLSACSRAGLVDEGLRCFETMSSKHGVDPDVEHYACIVDSLGRAGQLEKAFQIIDAMPIEPDHCIWGALLSGCRIHGNVRLAELVARHLIELEPQHGGYRVLLSNVYADAQRWDDVRQVRAAMKVDGVNKCPGCSWIDVGGLFHKFFTADKSHIECTRIYFTLDGLTEHLKVEGYVPFMDSR